MLLRDWSSIFNINKITGLFTIAININWFPIF